MMRRRSIRFVAIVAALALVFSMAAPAMAAIPRDIVDGPGYQARPDKRPHPLGEKRSALRAAALEAQLEGKVGGDEGTYEVASGQWVELSVEDTGVVWTVAGEFPDYQHNSIPEPDRTVDNSTIWADPDDALGGFSQAYYNELLYAQGEGVNSMTEYFLEQSSGRYLVEGACEDWVTLPQDHTYYDDGTATNDTSENVWRFLEDMLNGWYAAKLADMSPAEIDAYLSQLDVWDRYDWDGDGVFDEPDGYIDHFQSIHSGEGEEAGGGELGDEAIWSHSWYVNYEDIGTTGPSEEFLLGGLQIGDSGYWIGDYTVQPENGGVGVFVHEFTHDLGLPDLYDTNAGENGTGFWTLMSSGSWLSDVETDIGSAPGHEGPWEKLMLGWLDEVIAEPGTSEITLGPVEYGSTLPQALVVNLPDKHEEWDIGAPYAGANFYYSGQGDNLRNTMIRSFTLASGASLTAMVKYGIEKGYDYACVIVSTDGGATWATVPTNLSNSSVEPNGIDGFKDRWTRLKVDLSAYPGEVLLGFQYVTDGGVAEVGFMVDDIAITGSETDGAETDTGWVFDGVKEADGFKVTTGHESGYFANYYLAEYRQYWGYDAALAMCYNFGFLKGKDAAANWVERFGYDEGLLVWYCDTSQMDNNTSVHPGEGFALPVDAHPEPLLRPDRKVWRNRVQAYDAAFGLESTTPLNLHYNSKLSAIPSIPGVAFFDDANSYYSTANPTGSVIIPAGLGARIEVLDTHPFIDGTQRMTLRVTAPTLP